jgi:acetyl esterase/lipase
MRSILPYALAAVCAASAWQPPPGHPQIPIWPHAAPDAHVDPHKIGVIGFSAGGHLAAAISTHFRKRLYAAVDRADEESCRPDFAILLYPGHLTGAATAWDARFGDKPYKGPRGASQLNPDIHITSETPPSFLLQAEDDPVDDVNNSLVYFAALKKAGVPAEIHIYPHGGHAFGLRVTDKPVSAWPALVERWLTSMAMLP